MHIKYVLYSQTLLTVNNRYVLFINITIARSIWILSQELFTNQFQGKTSPLRAFVFRHALPLYTSSLFTSLLKILKKILINLSFTQKNCLQINTDAYSIVVDDVVTKLSYLHDKIRSICVNQANVHTKKCEKCHRCHYTNTHTHYLIKIAILLTSLLSHHDKDYTPLLKTLHMVRYVRQLVNFLTPELTSFGSLSSKRSRRLAFHCWIMLRSASRSSMRLSAASIVSPHQVCLKSSKV